MNYSENSSLVDKIKTVCFAAKIQKLKKKLHVPDDPQICVSACFGHTSLLECISLRFPDIILFLALFLCKKVFSYF